jgi:hypothetical protein
VPAKDVRFVDTYPKPPAAHIPNGFSQVDRLGDLPDQIVFWPGDEIRDVGTRYPESYMVEKVHLSLGEKPLYEAVAIEVSLRLRTRVPEQLRVVSRGNTYRLYHNEHLSFASDEEELAFWSQEGISVCGLGYGNSGHTLWACADSFRKGHADVIVQAKPSREWYRAYKLHDIFAQHRNYVRAFTERLYGAGMDAEITYVAEVARELSQSE